MEYNEVSGDLIDLTRKGTFDVIAHGCNCFCTMGAGIAPQMAKAFSCDQFRLEDFKYKGDINKLGQIDYQTRSDNFGSLVIINCYTQYNYGMNHLDGTDKPFDYEAFDLCMRKINHLFKGKHIGLPQIGCGLAGADWDVVKRMIQRRLKDMKVTIVIYDK